MFAMSVEDLLARVCQQNLGVRHASIPGRHSRQCEVGIKVDTNPMFEFNTLDVDGITQELGARGVAPGSNGTYKIVHGSFVALCSTAFAAGI